jgi:hypothetical protein
MPSDAITVTAVVSAFVAGTWAGALRVEGTLDDLAARLNRIEQQTRGTRAAANVFPVVRRSVASTAGSEIGIADALLVETVKSRLVEEMGLLSLDMLRERQSSFAELYATGRQDETTYGTASYLGGGHFITVKHAVAAATTRPGSHIRLRIADAYVRASVVDTGDADGEVDPGDWAILRVDGAPALRPLRIDLHYQYPFADTVARMGNDYSRGIIATTGHVGQHRNGLVTCLTDGHPGVSGGGVLNRAGDLVGIQVGRLEGDFRFSFILPLRAEMFRHLRDVSLAFAAPAAPGGASATDVANATPDQPARSVATGGRALR